VNYRKPLTGTPTAYQPGHWFNSAFLDIEYQNYGWVKAKEGEEQFYWEHHSGKKSDPYFI
jgi:hypothetical protein